MTNRRPLRWLVVFRSHSDENICPMQVYVYVVFTPDILFPQSDVFQFKKSCGTKFPSL